MDSPRSPDQNFKGILLRIIKIARAQLKSILLLLGLILLWCLLFVYLTNVFITLPIIIASLLAAVVISRWKRPKQNSSTNRIGNAEEFDRDYLKNLTGLPTIFSFESLEKATGRFSKEIGTGRFGKVYEGILTDSTKVAVKCLINRTGQGQREYCAEIATISSLNHSNLVSLRGACVEGPHRILVYEFMGNGSLDKWLFHTEKRLDWKTRYSIALDAARGLAYLHEGSRHCIMHLDVKPENILLDEDFKAKVSDFSVARSLNRDLESRVLTRVRGTPGYMAPEWLLESGITSKSDVFSYGMVLLKIITGRKNMDNSQASQDSDNCYFPSIAFSKARQGRMDELIESGLELNRPHDMQAVYRLIKTALWCIQTNSVIRPSMGTVVRILEGDLEIAEPPLDCNLPFAPSIDDKMQV